MITYEEHNSIIEEIEHVLLEAQQRHVRFELLDVEKLVKKNNLREITNPIFFVRDNIPTSDGLLSNEIFGITKDQRANIFAYIDLYEYFMHPLCFIIWNSIDRRLSDIIHGTKKFIIDSHGHFVEDEENGDNGLEWIRKNLDKIKFKSTDSSKRDVKIQFLEENKNMMFMKKFPVIPAYYRDVNNAGGYVSVGEINKVYNSLILAVRSLKETADYGLNMSNAVRGRIQGIIVKIYQWFSGTSSDKEAGKGLSGKYGVIRRSVMSKTTDYGTRLVITAPELKCEKLEDLQATLDYTCIPLASLCSNLFPFIIFWMRRFFENQFSNTLYPIIDKKTKEVRYVKVKDPLIEFSDTRIKAEIERFMKGFSNRFIPIEVPIDESEGIKDKVWMKFKGKTVEAMDVVDMQDIGEVTPLFERRLTWCDLIFMACVEISKGKFVVITRYPMDSYLNQFATKIRVSSTKETEPMYVDNTFYKNYPKIREEDIGSNTSNKFVDTLIMTNLYLKAIGGDYDGDQVTSKVVFTKEANEELEKRLNSKSNFIDLGGKNIRTAENESIQSLYSLTVKLPQSNITEKVEIGKLKK